MKIWQYIDSLLFESIEEYKIKEKSEAKLQKSIMPSLCRKKTSPDITIIQRCKILSGILSK